MFVALNIVILILCFMNNIVCSKLTIDYYDDNQHSCGYIPPKPDTVLISYADQSSHRISKRQTYQNLRIRYFYDESINNISAEKFRIINETVLPEAINYWQQALKVVGFLRPLKLARRCINDSSRHDDDRGDNYCLQGCDTMNLCGEVVMPEEHLEECRICESDRDNRVCFVKQTLQAQVNNSTSGKSRTTSSSSGKPGETIPSSRRGVPDADFVLYISTHLSERCLKNNTIAYAAHCQLESRLNRPIAGHANICPNSILTKTQDLETLISTFKHEILHALGFSVSLYALYRDDTGQPYKKNKANKHNIFSANGNNSRPINSIASSSDQYVSRKVLKQVVRKDWKIRGHLVDRKVFLISTPRVVKEVREHFNCSTLEGAELENQGEEGTMLTHWEKRLFENEAMTGTHTQNPVYSRITLALMEDTGWYKANYSLAQPLQWGKNLGCDFAMKSCKEWIETKRSLGESIHPFCDKIKQEGEPLLMECTENRDSVALCNLRHFENQLELRFQNFENLTKVNDSDVSFYGGSVALADFCPYVQEFTWKLKDEIVRGSKCAFEDNNPLPEKNFAMESYGQNSRCFNQAHEMWEEKNCDVTLQYLNYGSGCYQYECRDGFLNVIVNNITFTCLQENQPLKIELFSSEYLRRGTILCPKCSEFCEDCKSLDIDSLHELKRKLKPVKHELKCSAANKLSLNICGRRILSFWNGFVLISMFLYAKNLF